MASIPQEELKEFFDKKYQTITGQVNASATADVLISFIGELDQHEVEKLASATEERMFECGASKKAVKKTFNIVIEALQNILLHGDKDASAYQHAYYLVAKEDSGYHIYTGNIIESDKTAMMDAKLKTLENKDEKELKAMYLEVLSEGELSHKGGAGLGFITIVLKSSNNFSYSFESINNTLSLFATEAKVID